MFSVQSHTRSPSVVNFSLGKKYVTLTGIEKVKMVAVILTADTISLVSSLLIQDIIDFDEPLFCALY